MEILKDSSIKVDINKIKADPEQPRKKIDETDLREMAESIITEGIINAIEVDKDFVIVTGERRWRAARIAGLKTMPVKIIEIGKDERFMRQVIENIHHDTMDHEDTANALVKLMNAYMKGVHGVNTFAGGKQPEEEGIRWLAKKIGRSPGFIQERVDYVRDMSRELKKAVKAGLSPTFVRAIKQAPEKYKQEIEERIIEGEFVATDGAIDLAVALKRERDNPKIIKKLLDMDYSKYETDYQIKEAVAKISPPIHEIIAKTYEPSKEISRIVDDLKDWVGRNPMVTVGKIHAPRIIVNMNFAKSLIDQWFKNGKILKTKLLK